MHFSIKIFLFHCEQIYTATRQVLVYYMRMNKDISVQKIEKRKAVDMNKQINNLITFSFECTKYTEDRITKNHVC